MTLSAVTVVVRTAGQTGLATTVLASLGVGLALLALAWQAWSFRLSGSRVSVELRAGMQDAARTVAVTTPGPGTPEQGKYLHAQGFTHPVLAVEVRNSGRSSTSIVAVSIRYANGASFTEAQLNPSLPFRLEAESEKTWNFERAQIQAYASAMGQVLGPSRLDIQGSASIGGRMKPVLSKNKITL